MAKKARAQATTDTTQESLPTPHFRYHAVARLDEHGIPGWLVREYKRCGKVNCRCARGQLHGPYFYHVIRNRAGRRIRRYVRLDEVGRVDKLCQLQRSKRVTRRQSREAIRTLKRLWAQVEGYLSEEG